MTQQPPEMPSPMRTLQENFYYNSMLATSLVQLFPTADRCKISSWLSKLHSLEQNGDLFTGVSEESEAIRNDYMWYLLLVLQNGRLTVPFCNMPPPGQLQPLTDVLPAQIYEDVLTASTNNYSWVDKVAAGEEVSVDADVYKKPAPPCHFFDDQPKPVEGIICYAAVFSNQTKK